MWYGNCHRLALECPLCHLSTSTHAPFRHDWCLRLLCKECMKCWYICRLCPLYREKIYDRGGIRNHDRYATKKHDHIKTSEVTAPLPPSDSASTIVEQGFNTEDELPTSESEFIGSVMPREDYVLSPETISHLKRSPHLQYFLHEAKGAGGKFLTAVNVFENSLMTEMVSHESSKTHLCFGRLVLGLTKAQIALLVELINSLHSWNLPLSTAVETTGQISEVPHFPQVILPNSVASVRSVYTQGKFSLKQCLPHPAIQMVGSDDNIHSYSSLIDCIETHLAFGIGVCPLEDSKLVDGGKMTNPEDTPKCDTIRSLGAEVSTRLKSKSSPMRTMTIAGSFFSDDFDPTVSLVKANGKHSVWVLHVTFLSKPHDSQTSEFGNTYILAIGPKGGDHEFILKMVENDINKLQKGGCGPVFCSKTQGLVLPVFSPWIKHGDQPERRQLMGLKLGQGNAHSRSKHSVRCEEVGKFLPACHSCRSKLENIFISPDFDASEIESIHCKICTNWSFDERHDILHSTPPSDFPIDKIPVSGKLPPIVLTNDRLSMAAEETHEKLLSGEWSVSSAQTYLGDYHCLKTDLRDAIIEKALNCKLLSHLRSQPILNNVALQATEEDALENPHQYIKHPHPVSWTQSLSIFPEAPMHLFSGLMKASESVYIRALKLKGLFSSLLHSNLHESHFSDIEEMGLKWFTLMIYKSDKFGGYGSETHISLARYAKCHAREIKLLPKAKPFAFPTIPQEFWNKAFNVKWLEQRGLEVDGNATEIRARVNELMNGPDCPPVIDTDEIKIDQIVRLLASTHNAFAHALAKNMDEDDISKMHASFIRLLNHIEDLDSIMRSSKEKMKVNMMYNCLSLLNVAEDTRQLGPPRCRWEGGAQGEKAIKYIKANFVSFHNTWQKCLHEGFSQARSLEMVGRSQKCTVSPTDQRLLASVPNIYVHDDAASAGLRYNLQKSIVLVRLLDQKSFGVVHSGNIFWPLSSISFVGVDCHQCYFNLDLSVDSIDKSHTITATDIHHVICAVPSKFDVVIDQFHTQEGQPTPHRFATEEDLLGNMVIEKPLYSLLDSEWMELDSDFRFVRGYR